MSLPQILDIPGGYVFDWKEPEKINIKVNHLNNKNGELRGEILITTSAPGYNPHLYLGTLNFMSGRTRKELTKQLSELYETDWTSILEQLVVYTVDRFRRGEPVEDILVDNSLTTPPEYLIHPLVVKNYPNVLFGDPGSFKSTFTLALIAGTVLPWTDNPLSWNVPEKPAGTMYLDWETDRDTVSWQLSRFQDGMRTGIIPIKYRRCSLPLYQDIERIMTAIVDYHIELVIIDSLGLACGGDLNEAATAIQFFSALRQLKVTSLILAHTSKDKLSKNKTIFGSVYFEAQARNIWHLKKRQESGEDSLDLLIKNTKPPPFSKKQQDLAYHVDFSDDTIKISKERPAEVGEFLQELSTSTRIIEYLKDNPKSTPKDIATNLGLTDGNVRISLKRLREKNLVVKLDGDNYGLLAKT